MGTTIHVSASYARVAHEVCGTVSIVRNCCSRIERSEINYAVDLKARVIALDPRVCFRQSDPTLSAEAVRDTLRAHCVCAETFAVVLNAPQFGK